MNIGLPQEVKWQGSSVATAIYKQPAANRLALRKLNLDGDRQADLSVHGGAYKAVCQSSASPDGLTTPGQKYTAAASAKRKARAPAAPVGVAAGPSDCLSCPTGLFLLQPALSARPTDGPPMFVVANRAAIKGVKQARGK